MSQPDDPPEIPLVNVHGIWFWKLAIFEGITSVFIAMSGAIMAAGATWSNDTFSGMEWWQWALFWLGVFTTGVKTLQAVLSKTVASLTETAKKEDQASGSLPYQDLR